MRRIEVSCITKTARDNPHERISHIGGALKDSYWKVPVAEAIHNIEMKFFSYYVNNGGTEVDIVVASNNGTKYLKTKNDSTENNNLLSLLECSMKHR